MEFKEDPGNVRRRPGNTKDVARRKRGPVLNFIVNQVRT